MNILKGSLTALALVFATAAAEAAPVLASDPGDVWDISARARNGRTGFELSFQNPNVANLNYTGTPAWSFGNPHSFSFTYTGATGQAVFAMDFNRNSGFEANETLSFTFASFAGFGFEYFDLFLQGNSTGNAKVDNFTVNGTNFGTFGFTSNNVVEQWFEDDTSFFQNIAVTGELTFSANGNTDERPRMWLRLGEEVQIAAVPEPATLALLGAGVLGLGIARRRRAA